MTTHKEMLPFPKQLGIDRVEALRERTLALCPAPTPIPGWSVPDNQTFVGIDVASGPDGSVWFQCQPDGKLRPIPEIPVTSEMRSIFHTICPTGPHTVDDDTLDRAYRAMHAAAPVELVSEAEPFSRASIDASTISSLRAQVICLDAENDEFRAGKVPEAWRLDARRIECENTRLHDALKVRTDERDAARAETREIFDGKNEHLREVIADRNDLRQRLSASVERNQIILRYYHGVCARLHAKTQGIVTQETVGDTTYSVFASDPQTVVVDSKHTKADVKPPPPPKPFPAGALKPNTTDPRRLGG